MGIAIDGSSVSSTWAAIENTYEAQSMFSCVWVACQRRDSNSPVQKTNNDWHTLKKNYTDRGVFSYHSKVGPYAFWPLLSSK